MIDYRELLEALTVEKEESKTRYGGMVPLYYQEEINRAISALVKCRDSLNDLTQSCKKDREAVRGGDSYKVSELTKMLLHETSKTEEHYGAHLTHWFGDTKPLTIDAGGISALIVYYSDHDTEL